MLPFPIKLKKPNFGGRFFALKFQKQQVCHNMFPRLSAFTLLQLHAKTQKNSMYQSVVKKFTLGQFLSENTQKSFASILSLYAVVTSC